MDEPNLQCAPKAKDFIVPVTQLPERTSDEAHRLHTCNIRYSPLISVCRLVCLYVCLSVCMCVCLPVRKSVCMCVCLPVRMSVCMCVSLPACLSDCKFVAPAA